MEKVTTILVLIFGERGELGENEKAIEKNLYPDLKNVLPRPLKRSSRKDKKCSRDQKV